MLAAGAVALAVHRPHLKGVPGAVGQVADRLGQGRTHGGPAGEDSAVRLVAVLVIGDGRAAVVGRRFPAQGDLVAAPDRRQVFGSARRRGRLPAVGRGVSRRYRCRSNRCLRECSKPVARPFRCGFCPVPAHFRRRRREGERPPAGRPWAAAAGVGHRATDNHCRDANEAPTPKRAHGPTRANLRDVPWGLSFIWSNLVCCGGVLTVLVLWRAVGSQFEPVGQRFAVVVAVSRCRLVARHSGAGGTVYSGFPKVFCSSVFPNV